MKTGFLHTAQSHIELFDSQLRGLPGEVEAEHLVDDGLLQQAIDGVAPDRLKEQAMTKIQILAGKGCRKIFCTCSTIGSLVEDEVVEGVRVERIDRAAADELMGYRQVLVLCVLESAVQAADQLLDESKAAADAETNWVIALVPNAWSLFMAGDIDGYNESISSFANGFGDGFDAVFLAQASMAGAKPGCLHSRVLTSPESGLKTISGC